MLTSMSTIRVLLVDDHTLVRAGLRLVLEQSAEPIAVTEASNRDEALRAVTEQPDVILLDLDLGDDSGLDLIPLLRAACRQARILVLTGLRDAEAHRSAVRLGAVGVVLKDKATSTLLKAVAKVHAGEIWLDRMMIADLLGQLAPAGGRELTPDAARIALLTPRERHVITLIGHGCKNQQIAAQLNISEATVRHHLTSIFGKLEVADRGELIVYAYRHRLAQLPQ